MVVSAGLVPPLTDMEERCRRKDHSVGTVPQRLEAARTLHQHDVDVHMAAISMEQFIDVHDAIRNQQKMTQVDTDIDDIAEWI